MWGVWGGGGGEASDEPAVLAVQGGRRRGQRVDGDRVDLWLCLRLDVGRVSRGLARRSTRGRNPVQASATEEDPHRRQHPRCRLTRVWHSCNPLKPAEIGREHV